MAPDRTAEDRLHDQTNVLSRGRLLVTYLTLGLTLFITYCDQTGIGVALPVIARDLHAANTISWAGTSALIANTVFQVLYGRLSDILGRKPVYLSAIMLLTLGDLLCAIAPNAYALYVFRGISGIAQGGVNSLTMMIVSDIVTLRERGKYQGILGLFIGLGNTVGPLLFAAFAQGPTWRGMYYLLAPSSFLCVIGAYFLVPSKPPQGNAWEKVKLIDWYGIVTGCIGVVLLLIPVSGGGSYFAWDSPMVIAMLVISGISLCLFVYVEGWVSALPITPLSMLKSTPVAVLLLQCLFFGLAFYPQLYYIPIYAQNVKQYTPLVSACLTVPMLLVQAIVSALSGQYISKTGRYGEVIWSGYVIWLLGTGLMIRFDENTSIGVIFATTIVAGLGVGNIFQPVLVAIQAHAPKSYRAVVISNRNFLRSLGGAIGLAVCAQLLQSTLKRNLPAELQYIANSTYHLPNLNTLSAQDRRTVIQAFSKASHSVFIFFAPFIGGCLVTQILVPDRGLEQKEDSKGPKKDIGPDTVPAEVDSGVEKPEMGVTNGAPDIPGALATSKDEEEGNVPQDEEKGNVSTESQSQPNISHQ